MFKLRIIAGPLRGNSYEMKTGENSIGRVDGNDVVLNSGKVSKKHCMLVINGGAVTVRDAGSSNGTFVNGVLTTVKKISPGDRISVGEHVLELVKPAMVQKSLATAVAMPGNVLPMNRGGMPLFGADLGLSPMPGAVPSAGSPSAPAPPKDYIEKVKFYFEKYVINFLYTLNEKHEWNLIVKGLLALLIVFTACVSVFPVIQKTQDILMVESRNRARALARLMVDRNTGALLKRNESDLDISFAEREEGIVAAYIVDMDLRVMAPGKKLNTTLTDGQHGRFADNARKHFEKNERYFSMPYWNSDGTLNETFGPLEGNILGIAEPVKVVDPSKNQNVVVAFAVVFLDLNTFLVDDATALVILGTSIVFASIMGLAVFASIHRLTTRPLHKLNEGVDRVLRGEASNISMTAKMEEIEPLMQIMNTAMQKIGSSGTQNTTNSDNPDDFLNPARFAAASSASAMMVISADYKLLYMNAAMEEVTGIRLDGNIGADVYATCRDDAFALMLKDLIGRSSTGLAEGVSDSLEFSGVNYQIESLGLGSVGGSAKGYLVAMKKV